MVITIGDQRETGFCYQDYFINRSSEMGMRQTWTGASNERRPKEKERERGRKRERLRFSLTGTEYNRKRKSRREVG